MPTTISTNFQYGNTRTVKFSSIFNFLLWDIPNKEYNNLQGQISFDI